MCCKLLYGQDDQERGCIADFQGSGWPGNRLAYAAGSAVVTAGEAC